MPQEFIGWIPAQSGSRCGTGDPASQFDIGTPPLTDERAAEKAATIVDELSSHEQTKTHARHIHRDKLKELGVKVVSLEDDPKLQDAVLTVHHACVNTLMQTPAVKIIENQNAVSFIVQVQVQATTMPFPFPGTPAIPMRPNVPGQPVFPNIPGIPGAPKPQGEMVPDPQGQPKG